MESRGVFPSTLRRSGVRRWRGSNTRSLTHGKLLCNANNTGLETYLYSLQTDGVQIVCPVSERTCRGYTDIVTPYGFSGFVGNGDSPEFSRRWVTFVKLKGYVCGYINLNPLFENSTYFESLMSTGTMTFTF